MPIHRVTMFMTQGSAGWSESWYVDAEIGAAISAIKAQVPLRRALLATGALVVGLRASQVDPPGFSLVETTSNIGSSGLAPDTPFQSLLLRFDTNEGQRRRFQLRGLPDARCVDGVYSPQTTYDLALQTWQQGMVARTFALRVVNLAHPVVPVASVSTTGLMTVSGTPGWTAGQTVKLYRTQNTLGQNVSFPFVIASVPTASTFQLIGWPAGEIVSKGNARRREYVYREIVDFFNTKRVTSRRVGRPFGLPVGRRRRLRTLPA